MSPQGSWTETDRGYNIGIAILAEIALEKIERFAFIAVVGKNGEILSRIKSKFIIAILPVVLILTIATLFERGGYSVEIVHSVN